MPGTVKVRVLSARNLPIMDRSTYLTDAFVEICIGNITYKTEVIRRSLSPSWNSDWFCFELDDQSLQEEVLLLKVMDHDTYSTHDTIGRVYFDLNPLISRGQTRALNGWFPIYDTMHGIRGEINLAIRVDVFLDASRYHQSSVGVKFFHCCGIPSGHAVDLLIGFVQELVMNDDPEHQWIERIRTSRASNEARQRLFSRLSGELQRKLGLKVLNLGGNSIIGYQLHFDLEGETGVVVRGIGTAVRLRKLRPHGSPPVSPVPISESPLDSPDPTAYSEWEQTGRGSAGSLPTQQPLKLGEFPFLTISQVSPGMIRHFGSVVASKSVNLMDKNTPAGIQFRDAWWLELRTEVMQHMHSMNCNAVLGYREECSIYEDVCVLSNYGTAVILDPSCFQHVQPLVDPAKHFTTQTSGTDLSLHSNPTMRVAPETIHVVPETVTSHDPAYIRSASGSRPSLFKSGLTPDKLSSRSPTRPDCAICHIPTPLDSSPKKHAYTGQSNLRCALCKAAAIPDLLLASVDFPPELPVKGKPALIQARTCRSRKFQKGEQAANEISELLPFIEFELHYRLLQKLRLLGMNAVFGLRFRLSIGESFVAAIATGTAVFVTALSSPPVPKADQVNSSSGDRTFRKTLQLQVRNYIRKCRQAFGLNKQISRCDECGTGTPLLNAPVTQEGVSDRFKLNGHSHVTSGCEEIPESLRDTAFLENREPEPEELAILLQDPIQPSDLLLLTTDGYPDPQMLFGREGSETSTSESPTRSPLAHNHWPPAFGFARVHEEKLTSPDSFVESSSFTTDLTVNPVRNETTIRQHSSRHSTGGGAPRLHSGVAGITFNEDSSLNNPRRLGDVLNESNQLTWFRFRHLLPCVMMALDYKLTITEDDFAQIVTTGMLFVPSLYSDGATCPRTSPDYTSSADPHTPKQLVVNAEVTHDQHSTSACPDSSSGCLLTPLTHVPHTVVEAYLGNLDFFFIRETNDLRDAGGVCGFLHTSLTEVQAVVGAHTASLGGNALLSYHLSEVVILRPASRNQAQCLLNVCGDMARISHVSIG